MGGPSIPNTPTPPPTAKASDPAVLATLDAERKRRAAAGGRDSTILNGAQGLTTPAPTAPHTLLGA